LLVDDASDELPLLKIVLHHRLAEAMNVHQKGKNIHSQQQQQPQPQSGPPSYPNQQSRPNATYHFDDASQSMYIQSFIIIIIDYWCQSVTQRIEMATSSSSSSNLLLY
jgi:hypothetical protein